MLSNLVQKVFSPLQIVSPLLYQDFRCYLFDSSESALSSILVQQASSIFAFCLRRNVGADFLGLQFQDRSNGCSIWRIY